MKRFFRLLLVLSGYLLYTVCVTVILLWVLFPSDSALVWLQGELRQAYPSLAWNISGLEKAFPPKLRLTGVRIHENNDPDNPPFVIDEINVSPALGRLVKLEREVPLRYDMQALDGTVRGEAFFPLQGDVVECSGEAGGLELAALDAVWDLTNREGSGTMSGRFRFTGAWQDPLRGKLEADLQVRDGTISLVQPIFGLQRIDFHDMSTDLSISNRIVSLEDGRMDSRLFSASYKGVVRVTDNLYTSSINIQGSMEPRPEMLAGLQNPTAVSLIKSQLRDDKLSFTLSGSLMEPGIQFRGTSGVIDGVIEGGAR
jgi:type II secretion system protein N